MSHDLLLTQVYRRAAVSFVVLTIALLVLVAFVVLPKAIIVVTPDSVVFEKEIPFTVGLQASGGSHIEGLSVVVDIALEETIEGTAKEELYETLSGTVTITNNYSKQSRIITF